MCVDGSLVAALGHRFFFLACGSRLNGLVKNEEGPAPTPPPFFKDVLQCAHFADLKMVRRFWVGCLPVPWVVPHLASLSFSGARHGEDSLSISSSKSRDSSSDSGSDAQFYLSTDIDHVEGILRLRAPVPALRPICSARRYASGYTVLGTPIQQRLCGCLSYIVGVLSTQFLPGFPLSDLRLKAHNVVSHKQIVCTKSPPPYLPPPTYPPPTPPYPPPTSPPTPPPTSPPYLPPPTSPPYLRLASLDRRLASLDAGASPRTPLK